MLYDDQVMGNKSTAKHDIKKKETNMQYNIQNENATLSIAHNLDSTIQLNFIALDKTEKRSSHTRF